MTEHANVNLTASEISQLWAAYQNDSLAICVLNYFLQHCEDADIRAILEKALQTSQEHVKHLRSIFQAEQYPIPEGFQLDKDVNLEAKRLFSDMYMLYYLNQMGTLGLNAYSVSLPLCPRSDIYSYFSRCLSEADRLLRWTMDVLLEKGLYIRSPYIPMPRRVDFVKQTDFLAGYFEKRRPLTALEIANLYSNAQRNALGEVTMIGFAQVAESEDVKKFLRKGMQISAKHTEIFHSILREQRLSAPMAWDSAVTTSTEAPFSEKLMMFQTASLSAIGLGYYGTSLATSPRHDIAVHYTRLMAEVGKYSEFGARIMIDHGWMEEPPKAPDRESLTMKK